MAGGGGGAGAKSMKDSDSDSDDDSSSEDEDEEEEEEEREQLSLSDMFEVGQTVRCTVRQLGKGKSGGKRIDLSLRLSVLCAGVSSDAIAEGGASCVPACVESVEDHGYVLSFGVVGAPRGFLPRKSAPSGRTLNRRGRCAS